MEPVLFGRSRCEDVKAKTLFLLLFSLFLYEKEPEPVKTKYLEPEHVKKGPAPQHCTALGIVRQGWAFVLSKERSVLSVLFRSI